MTISESDLEKMAETYLEFHATVGQGISSWTQMEGRVVEIAACLLGTTNEKAGLIFYSIMNFNVWLSIVSELFTLSPNLIDLKDAWNQEAEHLRSLNDIRVRLAHHSVSGAPKNDPALRPHSYDSRSKSKKHSPLKAIEVLHFTQKVVNVSEILETLSRTLNQRIAVNVMGPQSALLNISSEPMLDLEPPSVFPQRRSPKEHQDPGESSPG